MNVVEVLGLATLGYFVFVALWITKIEDYLQIEGADDGREDADGR